jgi:tape measure domain-containing protein
VATLQVNASTQQAVGAFNALAASINSTNSAFARLNTTMQGGSRSAGSYANSITAINSAFGRLHSMLTTVSHGFTVVGAAVEFVFSSMLKQLDKLQGFNAIMSVTTKSADDAAQSYDFLRATADKLGLRFEDLSGNYAKLVASLPEGTRGLEIAQKAFIGVSEAARTLHASNSDTQLMFYAVSQMASKGVVSMEELRRQLGEKLPGTMKIAARAVNALPEELEAAIRKGIVSSEKFLNAFSDELIRTFADSSAKASASVSASINRLKNVWIDFVKEVLDSGGGQAIVGLFDALREKLSDPYLITRFSELVKDLATRFTEFIQKLTADDIRNGFDTLARGIDLVVKLVGKLIEGMTWVINNGGKAGAIVGGLAGASFGAVAGPWGAAVGGLVGAGVGASAGLSLMSSEDDNARRRASDAAAEQAKVADARYKEILKLNALVPMLGNFKGLKSFNGLENLLKAENLNTKTLADLNRILTGKEYKTDADKAKAVLDYSKYGQILGPGNTKLSDVLGGPGKNKVSAAQRAEDATLARANGLNANFAKELSNLNALQAKGKLSMEQYTDAVQDLVAKQPYMIEYTKDLAREQRQENIFREQALDLTIKQIDVKDDMRRHMDDELRLAGMRSDQLRVEQEVQRNINTYIEAGLPVKQQQIEQWREEIRLRTRIQELTAVGEQIFGQTVGKYEPQLVQQQAMDQMVQNPASGFTEENAKNYTARSDQNFQGSSDWITAQKESLDQYYQYIDALRMRDRISEEAANLAKARANSEYNKVRMQQTTDLFDTLSTLSSSGNKRLAAIGKAAAIANATMKAYEAINVALALPFPMNYLQAAAVGLQAFANIRAIQSAGFMAGGYTGDMPTNQVAGAVHGKEFVSNAGATRRNRAMLEAMNAGATFQVGGGGSTSVVVNNNATGTKASAVERDTPDGRQIEVTIEEVVVKNVRRGGRIADAVESQYGLNRAAGTVR